MADATGIDWFGDTTGINKLTVEDTRNASATTGSQPAPAAPSIDWFGDTTGLNKLGAPDNPSMPAAAGSIQSWREWLKVSVVGKHDPAYAGVGSVYGQFPRDLEGPMGMAATRGLRSEVRAT